MTEFNPEEEGPHRGEIVVFWTWAAIICVGLATMIMIPLLGR
jgi:hypothetical protein